MVEVQKSSSIVEAILCTKFYHVLLLVLNPYLPSQVDYSILINWTSPFLFLGMADVLFLFSSYF